VTEVRLPKLGQAMTEGRVIGFGVEPGAVVAAGDTLYVVETDKVEADVPAPATGRVRFVATVGEEYPVGALIAVIE
jgi:pyruvate/2-oxoglutarate dehydrogenase complex dihydrolipoamide acyltransferase (E2) component